MNNLFVLLSFMIIITTVNSFQSFYEKNACTDGMPDRKLQSLGHYYGTFICDREKYGRGRILNCSFSHKLPDEGEEGVNHFLCTVLIKDKSKQNKYIGVGKFLNWTDNATPVKCKPGVDTTLINKDDIPKDTISFLWKSPAEDLGQLYFVMSYAGSEYYLENGASTDLGFIDYPVSLKECGKKKSCMRYAFDSENRDAASCEYAITFGFSESDQNTVKFTFDVHETDENAFLAIAFAKNIPEEDNVNSTNVFICVKRSKAISMESYIINEKHELVRSKMEENFQDINTDHDKYYFGCKFEIQVKVSGKNPLDLNENLYRMYYWGKFNKDKLTLPEKPSHISKEALNLKTNDDDVVLRSGSASKLFISQNMLLMFVLCLMYFH